ncbi:unnamed protein product [Toxocara canis]|uniref:Baculoviral IAP repeat-containing protein 2 n=1 Tax=Toxocara canis TaxID=6265 RepID=A0A183VF14_TOXCA|nr:unnamed protein product [Toxocara canis]
MEPMAVQEPEGGMTTSNFQNVRTPLNGFPERGDMPNAVRSTSLTDHAGLIPSQPLSQILESYTPYMFHTYRVQSFSAKWPHTNSNLSPEKMAQAGFFYNPSEEDGEVDNVTCPFCLKELTGWEPNDDPTIEHSKRKEGCWFMRLGKCERDFTVADFILLLAQRHASLMVHAYWTSPLSILFSNIQ